MIVALSAVACVMVVIGLGLVVQGTPFTRLEWGWTMVLSGTIAATGGVLLAGVAVLAAALGRVERALGRRDAHPNLPPLPAGAVPAAVEAPVVTRAREPGEASENRAILAAGDLLADAPGAPLGPAALALPADEPSGEPMVEGARPTADEAGSPAAKAPPTVVGTYASGGNAYVMYSDGSIAADTPRGHFTFGSLDELKTFVAEGGEEGGPTQPKLPASAP
jgi:hypothetical protein